MDTLKQKCPNVYTSINLEILTILIAIHDLGEGGRGDLPNGRSIDQHLREKIKKNEVLWGKYFLKKGIVDETIRKRCIDIFMAYEFRNDPENKTLTNDQKTIIQNNCLTLSLMKWLDYAQAVEKGSQNGYGYLTQNNEAILPLSTGREHENNVCKYLSKEEAEEFTSFSSYFLQKHEEALAS